ncbi:MAG TPA: hypothetical protein VH170_01575 [Chthoniobacterales bacterium]|jgi:hypothetical protein|nr:hypothetical protein [Chthoniobacterales bacterium]
MIRAKPFFLLPLVIGVVALNAQSPAPIIVQPANAVTSVKSTTAAPAPATTQSIPDAIKALEQIKAGNAEVLAKQKAALEKLDELQEAADQMRIFGKRG